MQRTFMGVVSWLRRLPIIAMRAIGEVQSVYIDSTSHGPAWLVAKLTGSRRRGGRMPPRDTRATGDAGG